MIEVGTYKDCKIRADISPTREGGPWAFSEIIIDFSRGAELISQQLYIPDDGPQIFNTEKEAAAYVATLAMKWIDNNL